MGRYASRLLALAPPVMLVTALTFGPAACSLLTSFDGLASGDATGTEGGTATSEGGGPGDGSAGADGTTDGNVYDAPVPAQAATVYFDAVLLDNPIAFFHLDEKSGTTATSAVGNWTGTYQGTVGYGAPSAVGTGDTSILFDGTSTRLDLGDVFAFSGTASYSIECWAKPRASGDTRFLWNRRTTAAPFEGYTVYFGSTYFLFAREAAGAELGYASLSAGPTLDVWTHVVATFDGGATAFYLNGALVGQNAGASTPIGQGAGSFIVGDHNPGQFNKFYGELDELSVFDKALSAKQVLAHFQAVKR